ncbi:C4-dicarboxylate ABC transporter [Streptomyces sp. NPDC048057]|uniref:SLAC1 family transporter n=1 Tax=Streptomyces sp. NPDC048057 TaxID=3155628 RepID=UPI0033FE030A
MATAVPPSPAPAAPLAARIPVQTAPAGPDPVRSPARLPALRHVGPQWYAAVMGTAIVASAGAALPLPAAARPALVVVWTASALLLLTVASARAGHWLHHRDQARAHLLDPAVAPFYGCAAMAPLAVAAGTLSVGRDVLGSAAVPVAAALFAVGCALAVTVAVAVPYLLVVRHRPAPGTAAPGWLLPLVAPMVAAAVGPLLALHLADGEGRRTLLAASLALFGLSLLATLVMVPLVFARLVHHGPLPLALTPSLFLVLGPLGQSTTAAGHLADAAPAGLPYADAVAVLYGVPVLGFALMWLALAGAMVVRAARRGLPFTLSWWAFTFPVGTCVTGAAGLAHRTDLSAFAAVAAVLYALLVTAWAVTGLRTARGLLSGALLRAPRPAPGAPSPATARTT